MSNQSREETLRNLIKKRSNLIKWLYAQNQKNDAELGELLLEKMRTEKAMQPTESQFAPMPLLTDEPPYFAEDAATHNL